jgi:tetratricopeptide (TPR) repeat protein
LLAGNEEDPMTAGGERSTWTRATSSAARRGAVAVALSAYKAELAAAACSSGPSQKQKVSTLLAAGIAAEQSGSYAAAITDFNQVLQIAPNDKNDDMYAYYNRGLSEQLTNNHASAQTDYDSALAINPNFAPALYNLAIVVTSSNPARAQDLYLQVIAIQPQNWAAHLNLAFVYQTLGNTASAIDQFKIAVKGDPKFVSNVPAALRAKVLEGTTPATGATGATGASTATGATGA